MTASETTSPNGSTKSTYDTPIRYLTYDTDYSDKLSLPVELRERHLTEGQCDAELQAIGLELQVTVWSERNNIVLRFPLSEWKATHPYKGKLTGRNNGILSIGRFSDHLEPARTMEDGNLYLPCDLRVTELQRPDA